MYNIIKGFKRNDFCSLECLPKLLEHIMSLNLLLDFQIKR